MKHSGHDYYIGVDVGGTKILSALVNSAGQVVGRAKRKTSTKGPKEIIGQIGDAASEVMDQVGLKPKDALGIGVGVPGVADTSTGKVFVTPNMPLGEVPLGQILRGDLEVPTFIGNDVNLGTLGEKWRGAAREASDVVGIFVGTGIGGGVVLGGRLHEGYRSSAGEIGHLIMKVDGPKCGCGNYGCMEALASRTAIERDIKEAIKSGRKSILTELVGGDLSLIKSSALKKAIERRDELTVEVLNRASQILGLGAASVIHLIDPEMIVFGGGVIEACGDFMLPIISQVASAAVLPGARSDTKIVRSILGDDAVVLGAVALVQQGLGVRGANATETSRSDGQPEYPVVESDSFGGVRVGGEVYNYDVVIRADGRVKKRKKKLSRREHGTAHKLSAAELEYVCKGDPKFIVIGAGYQGNLSLADDAEAFLRERGLSYEIHPAPEAAAAFNRALGRKALLFHVTC